MPSPFPPFAALALHQGNSRNLQLVGVGDDGALYLAAWQSHATGAWTVPDTNVLAFQTGTFSAVALASGNSDRLQVLGLGADQQIYLAAWQYEDGTWLAPIQANAGPMGDPARRYTAVAAHRGAGYLNVFGLGTDGRIYVVATQDGSGRWQADGRILSTPGISYASMVAVTDAQGWLQLLGLGTDGRAYWLASLSDGWTRRGEAIGNPKHRYTALAAALSNGGNLQVMGLGTDRKIYLAAWQDGKGKWNVPKTYGGPLGHDARSYVAITAHTGADRNLQVVCLGQDGLAYLAVYQDKSGAWHSPSSRSSGPLGGTLLTYQALALDSGDHADKDHPGNLQVVGLGAGENDDGIPYLVASQTRDGRWHAGGPLGKVRSPLVNWEAPTGRGVVGGCVAFGRFWVTQGNSVVSFDAISGAPGPTLSGFGDNASPRVVWPYGAFLAVGCDDGIVYNMDPETGQGHIEVVDLQEPAWWMESHDGALFVAGNGIFRIGPDGNTSVCAQGDIVSGTPAVADGILYVPVHPPHLGPSVDAFDATTLAKLWSVTADGIPGPVFCDGARLCFATDRKSLYVCDAASGALVTPRKKPIGLDSTTEIAPVYSNGSCYIAFRDAVQAINLTGRRPGRHFAPIRNPVGAPILNANGVLFYASEGQICVIDTSAKSDVMETYQTANPPPFLAAYQDGALYFADHVNATAVRLDEAIHQYYADASLIQDFDFSNSVRNPGMTPNFQVDVTLFDKDGSPRGGQPVRLTATAPTTVTYQGRTMPLSATDFVDVATDGAGRFRIAVKAGAYGRDGRFYQGLTAPELLLTSPFMDPRMRFVVRPHGQLQGQLATITKDQLKNATGYDKKPILKDHYRNDKALDAAAGAINQTAGMVRTSMTEGRKGAAGDMYCSSDCDMAVACCMPSGDPGCRVTCDQSFSFSLSGDQAHFRLLSAVEAEAAAATLAGSVGMLGDWDDFWDDVTSNAAKVTGAVIQAVADGARASIHYITKTGPKLVEGVIGAIEQATLLVQGIFNEIAIAMRRVVEAVSFLFDWKKILDVHDSIREEVNQAWTALESGAGGVSLDGIKDAFKTKLCTLKTEADKAFCSAKSAIGNRSVLSLQSEAAGKSKTMAAPVQGNWLQAKMQDSIAASAVAGPSNGLAAAAPSSLDFDPGDKVRSLFDDFLSKVGDSVAADYRKTIDNIREDLDLQSGAGLLARGLSVIFDIINGLVGIAIHVGQAVIGLLMDLLKALVGAARDFINQDPGIPFLSNLYNWATNGDKLTLLDLFCLIVAVPTAFALKLISREPAYASELTAEAPARRLQGAERPPLPVGWMTVAAGCAQAGWGVLSGFMGAMDVATQGQADRNAWWKELRIRCVVPSLVVVRGLLAGAIYLHQKRPDALVWLIWALPTLVIGLDVVTLACATSGGVPLGWKILSTILSCLTGALVVGMAAFLFMDGPRQLGDILALGFSVAVGVSLICKLAILINKPMWLALLVVVAGGAATAASGGMEIARGLIAMLGDAEAA
ncbi:hypothetical protein [Inquilinus sp. OTU3971]|uniref:hypothetical protein n=1 Tax=Inquilinus sp. OTU3971 TaxID=3043855 RepID=UPI00313D9ACC